MKLRSLLFLTLFLSANPLHAADIRVLSGEHDGFSRLVVLLPKGTEWFLRQAPGASILEVKDATLRYVLAPVFSYIPKTRITGVEQVSGGANIRIDTADATAVEAFALQSGAVVIDVKDEAPHQSVSSEPEHAPAPPPRRSVPMRQDALAIYWKDIVPKTPDAEPGPNSGFNQSFATDDPRVKKAETELLEQLGRAAAQGLIHVSPPRPAIYDLPVNQIETGKTALPPEEDEYITAGDHLALHAETSMDRDWRSRENRVEISDQGFRCASDRDFDIAAWRGGDTPAQLIGIGRRELLGEFDHPRPDSVLTLARTYVSMGFGAEALQLLTSYEIHEPSADSLDFIARIIEGRAIDGASPFLAMTDCDAKVALWAFLGSSLAPDRASLHLGVIQRTFAALPPEVRMIVGPRLVDRLIEIGAADIATTIRAALARISHGNDAQVGLVDAQIARAEGKSTTADGHLERLVTQNSEISAEALVELVEGRLSEGIAIDDATVEQAGALAFELGGSATGLALMRAHILGHGSVGRFEAAFDALNRWKPEWDQARKAEVLSGLLVQIAQVPSDELLLTTYFGHRNALNRVDIPRSARIALAERLIDLGFASAGREVLSRAAEPLSAEHLLMARAALSERDAPAALSYLNDISTKDAARLRGFALQMLGEHAAALAEFEKTDAPVAASAEAWRSGAWDHVMQNGSEQQKTLLSTYGLAGTDRHVNESSVETQPPGPLARAGALLARSASERQALQELLDQYPLPDPEQAPASPTPGF